MEGLSISNRRLRKDWIEISWEEYQKDFPKELKERWNSDISSRPQPPYLRHKLTKQVKTQAQVTQEASLVSSATILVVGIFILIIGVPSIISSRNPGTFFYLLLGIIATIWGASRLQKVSRLAKGSVAPPDQFMKSVLSGMVQTQNGIDLKDLNQNLKIPVPELRVLIEQLVNEKKLEGYFDGNKFFPTGDGSQFVEILLGELNRRGKEVPKTDSHEYKFLPKTPISQDVDFKSVMVGMAKAQGKVDLAFLSRKFGIKLKAMKTKIYALIGEKKLTGAFDGDYFCPSMEINQAIDNLIDAFDEWGSEKKT